VALPSNRWDCDASHGSVSCAISALRGFASPAGRNPGSCQRFQRNDLPGCSQRWRRLRTLSDCNVSQRRAIPLNLILPAVTSAPCKQGRPKHASWRTTGLKREVVTISRNNTDVFIHCELARALIYYLIHQHSYAPNIMIIFFWSRACQRFQSRFHTVGHFPLKRCIAR
jgi:hypothetical protein